MAETALAPRADYKVTPEQITALALKCVITEITTTAEYEQVKVAIRERRDLRVGVDKRRKELKAGALAYCNQLEHVGQELITAIRQTEDPLKEIKAAWDYKKDEAKRVKDAAERDRINKHNTIIEVMRLATNRRFASAKEIEEEIADLESYDPKADDFREMTQRAVTAKEETIAELVKMHEAKLEEEANAEKLEQQRKDQAAEEVRQAEQRKELKAQQDKIDQEKTELEFEREEKEREEREAAEAKETEEKAQAEIAAAAKRVEEAEARALELKPDKEKLAAWLRNVLTALDTVPDVEIADDELRRQRDHLMKSVGEMIDIATQEWA